MNASRSWSILPVLALVAGCQAGAQPTGAQPVGAQNAQPVGGSLASSMESSAGSYGPDGGAGFLARRAFGTAPCESATTDVTDVDQDGIPDDPYTLTFTDCTGGTELGAGTLNGTYTLDDTLVETPLTYPFNFSIDADVVIEGESERGVGTIEVSHGVLAHQDATSFGTDESGSVSARLEAANGAVWQSNESFDWSGSYEPGAAVFGDGQLDMSGAWSIEASYTDADGNDYDVFANSTVDTTTPLQLDVTCATHIVSGAIDATFESSEEGSATLTVTWTACGQHTVTFTETPAPAG